MHALRRKSGQHSTLIALATTLCLVPLVLAGSPASAAEYQLQGTVSYVSNGTKNELDLTQVFHSGQAFAISSRINSAAIVSSDPHESGCMSCVTDLSFSVGGYGGTLVPGAVSLVQVLDNAPEDGDACGGQDPEIDEFLVSATGLNAPAVASAPLTHVVFGFIDCQAGAWASLKLPDVMQQLPDFEVRIMVLFFFDGSRGGSVIATINQAVVPVAQGSWGQLKMRYR